MVRERDEPLLGGAQTAGIVRRGAVVVRPRHDRSDYVQAVLRHLEAVGFTGAPRAMGFDADGREMVSYLAGYVPPRQPYNLTDEQLVSSAMLVRSFHDAIAGSVLCGDSEIVCHGDLGPHNTVFDGGSAVAIIDWDSDVSPGSRVVDFAHAVWCCADVTDVGVPVDEQSRRITLMCAAYGLLRPTDVVDELADRFHRARTDHLNAGRAGAVEVFDGLTRWLTNNRDQLLRRP
ncbi:phosphotransferase [uncultured Jatrophihabitans sp.]|uniref:phosphotransferase n=1 Tax=uncultured Jatrophihabitans sp. TaxID=1610747 RepID=UPI0035CB6E67